MMKRIKITALFTAASFAFLFAFLLPTQAQQTLGGITGTVTDTSGAVVPNALITLVSDQQQFTRTEHSSDSGSYLFSNLPIGTYTLTFTHDAFESQKIPSITVQADRTVSVNAALKVGSVSTTVTVEETPLINAVDTTNGYVLDKVELEAVPLPTGSFTGLAILSPGVNAELSGGTGANSGLGNAPIWANGNRDTSNTFLLNGVDAKTLFNGKTHQPGHFGSRGQQYWCQRRGQQRSRTDSEQRFALPGCRRVFAHARSRIDSGIPCEYLDVRRAAGFDQRRAH